jgi:hypothetical protein
MQKPAFSFLEWEKPASTKQLLLTTKHMGLVGGVLADVVAHDWRRGAARDVANMKLPSDGMLGVADAGVARTLGQTRRSLSGGVTDRYVGDIEADVYTPRVEQLFHSRKQPAIGAPFKKPRLRKEEVDEYCRDNAIDPSSSSGRQRAMRALHSQKKSDWMEAEKNRTLLPTLKETLPTSKETLSISKETLPTSEETLLISKEPPSKKPRLRKEEVTKYCRDNDIDPSSNSGRQRAKRALHSQKKSDWMEAEKSSTLLPISKETPPISKETLPILKELSENDLAGHKRLPTPTTEKFSADFISVLDPRLLLDNADSVEVDDSELQRLQALLLDGTEELDEEQEATGLDALLENIESSQKTDGMLTLPGHQFVEAFSKINIVRSSTLAASQAKLDKTFPTKVPMGNTRDYPTLYLYKCSKCDYKYPVKWKVDMHSLICKQDTKKPTLFQCDHGDCNKSFSSEPSLKAHINDYHDWIPGKCATPNCSDRIFENRKAWAHHLDVEHRPIEPMTCTYGECRSKLVWKTLLKYKEHLRAAHRLMTVESQKPYLPEATEKSSHWPAGLCLVGVAGAMCDITFTTRNDLQRYLNSHFHGLSAAEARENAGEVGGAQFELIPRAENDDTEYVESYVENGDEDSMFV